MAVQPKAGKIHNIVHDTIYRDTISRYNLIKALTNLKIIKSCTNKIMNAIPGINSKVIALPSRVKDCVDDT